MDAVFAAVAAFLGSAVGVVGGFYTQRWTHRRASADQLRELRRQTALAWLSAVHEMYQNVSDTHRELRRRRMQDTEAAERLRAQPSLRAQLALEDLRLSATSGLARSAAVMWVHLRREPVAIGQDLDFDHFLAWTEQYWVKRRQFINDVRTSQGQQPLDWETAGITAARPDEDLTRD